VVLGWREKVALDMYQGVALDWLALGAATGELHGVKGIGLKRPLHPFLQWAGLWAVVLHWQGIGRLGTVASNTETRPQSLLCHSPAP